MIGWQPRLSPALASRPGLPEPGGKGELDWYMTVVSVSHDQSSLDAVYVCVVPWPEFSTVPSGGGPLPTLTRLPPSPPHVSHALECTGKSVWGYNPVSDDRGDFTQSHGVVSPESDRPATLGAGCLQPSE